MHNTSINEGDKEECHIVHRQIEFIVASLRNAREKERGFDLYKIYKICLYGLGITEIQLLVQTPTTIIEYKK